MEKRKPGRPKNSESGEWGLQVQIRIDEDTAKAIEAYKAREGFVTASEAIRRLLRVGLKSEGMMPGREG